MQHRVRIVDIAEELGLSTATVSNVIHGKTKKISDETVRRVQALIEERGYIPSMAGILLAQNSSGIIGVVVNDHRKYEGRVFEDAFIASAVNALSAEIERAGMFLMIKAARKQEEIVRFASMWNMEGLVLIGFCEEDYAGLREKMHIPFVIYEGFFVTVQDRSERNRVDRKNMIQGCKNPIVEDDFHGFLHRNCEGTEQFRFFSESERVSNLLIDNFDGGRQVGMYLSAMGHKRILCISDNDICMDGERMAGCRSVMPQGAVDFLRVPMERGRRLQSYEAELERMCAYTAIFAVSDVYAIELLFFLQGHNIRVPEQISIVGFDDIAQSAQVCPMLTTVGQDVKKRAVLALEELARLKEDPAGGREILLPVQLVIRESVWRIDR